MKAPRLALTAMIALSPVLVAAQSSPHTPAPGSPERQAICDTAREFVLSKYATRKLAQPIVFKIDYLSVQERYAYFEATPRFKDGSYIPPGDVADIAYNFCLQKKAGHWTVILDLSRSDVPTADEVWDIRRRVPPDFPLDLFSPTWRDLLKGGGR